MLTATSRTNPVSYSKACDTFRPRVGQCAAIRADLGGKTFIHFFKPCAMLNSLVRQLIPEGRPTCIEYRLCHVGFSQSGGIDVAYRNIVKLLNDAMREFVVKIISSIRRSRLYRLDATFLSRSLTQSVFLPIVAIIPDEVTCARLPVKQSRQGLDAVTIDKKHTVIIYSSLTERQRLLAQPAPFIPRSKRRGFSEQI